jgi:aminocarboxymuconate-semialdehyde decarboxylase
MAQVIDGYSHFMPTSFAEALYRAHPTQELKLLSGLDYFGDLERRVRVLDKFGIDKQILTLARPTIWMGVPAKIVHQLTPLANDLIAEAARRFPDRFIPIGSLFIPDEESLPEFDRCVNDLGTPGIQIVANVDGRPLDSPEFEAFFHKANERRVPVWIHPQLWKEWSPEFCLDKIFGWLFDTTLALSRLVFSGMMERYPELRIIAHHMGAMIPHFSNRAEAFYGNRKIYPNANFKTLPKPPAEYFKRFYGDTVLEGAVNAFECGYSFFGPDHIIFATDYPFGPREGEAEVEGALHQIRSVELSETEKEKMLGGNLQRLLDRQ